MGSEPSDYNKNLIRLIELADKMLELAAEGDKSRNDPSCGILYGILRDAAYRLKALAELECEKHKQAGKWD